MRVEIDEVLSMDETEFYHKTEKLVYGIMKTMPVAKIKLETGLEYEDLHQIGMLGALKAKRTFNPELGLQFSTYAVSVIRGTIYREALTNQKFHVPRPLLEAYRKVVRAGLITEEAESISKQLDIPLKMVNRVKGLKLDVFYLDQPINSEEGEDTFGASLTDYESAADVAEDSITIDEFVATLKPRQRAVWEVYKQTNCGNQRQIAEIVGTSQVQVSRTLKAIFAKAEVFGNRLRAAR